MADFLKTIAASAFGTMLGIASLFLVVIFGITGLMSFMKTDAPTRVEEGSVLRIELSGPVADRAIDYPEFLSAPALGGSEPVTGLYEILRALKMAETDKRVRGVLVHFAGMQSGWASASAIHRALAQFKKSGKFVSAYAETYSEMELMVASAATDVSVYPEGGVELNGFAATPMFLKGTLAKLGVEPIVFRVGEFKAAVETFTRDSMSPEDRKQTETLINDLWGEFATTVTQARKINADALNAAANDLTIQRSEDAKKLGLVTHIRTERDVLMAINKKTGRKVDDEAELIGPRTYLQFADAELPSLSGGDRPAVAVLFLEGEIVDGMAGGDMVGSADVLAELEDIRKDKSIKAVVLRINSPGGSALASDVIWREIEDLKKQGRTVVTSFGDVAASGGYYIGVAGQKIFAEPNTITGSIGVFGLFFRTQKFFENTLGIKFDRATTHQFADLLNPNRELADAERKAIKDSVEHTYGAFLDVVIKGRKIKTREELDPIAQGRVWSGSRAKTLNLVDEIGGLNAAISEAAKMAKLGKKYDLMLFPERRNPLQEILEGLVGQAKVVFGGSEAAWVRERLQTIERMSRNQGVLTRMPLEFEIR